MCYILGPEAASGPLGRPNAAIFLHTLLVRLTPHQMSPDAFQTSCEAVRMNSQRDSTHIIAKTHHEKTLHSAFNLAEAHKATHQKVHKLDVDVLDGSGRVAEAGIQKHSRIMCPVH